MADQALHDDRIPSLKELDLLEQEVQQYTPDIRPKLQRYLRGCIYHGLMKKHGLSAEVAYLHATSEAANAAIEALQVKQA